MIGAGTGDESADSTVLSAPAAEMAPAPEELPNDPLGECGELVDRLLDLLWECDRHSYGEGLSMLAHALQTAAEMESAGGDEPLVVAALLHDIGHLVGVAGEYGDPDHAEAGARFLEPWLPTTVTEPIRLHVAAKRHLVATDPGYAARLSEASRITLARQGGPFTADESASFLAHPHAERAILLRRCDDLGKRTTSAVPPLGAHRERLARALSSDR